MERGRRNDDSNLEALLLVGAILSITATPVLHCVGVVGDVLIADEEELRLTFANVCKYLEEKERTSSRETPRKRDCIDYGKSTWPELEEYSRLAAPFLYAGNGFSFASFVIFIGTLWKSQSASWKARYFIVHSLVCLLTGALITTGLTLFMPKVTELVQGTLGYGVYLCAIAAGICFLHSLFLIVVIKSWVSYIRYKRMAGECVEPQVLRLQMIALAFHNHTTPFPFLITPSIQPYQAQDHPQFMPLPESFQRSKMSKYPKEHKV